MNESISLKVLGMIHTPNHEPKGMPIQGIFKPEVMCYVEIYDEYADCLKGVDLFPHLLLFTTSTASPRKK